MRNITRFAGLIAAAVLSCTTGAHAQGCVLCYTSLSAASPGAMRAFEFAMIVLLIPALTLFAGVFLFIFLRARSASVASGSLPAKKSVVRLPLFTPSEGHV